LRVAQQRLSEVQKSRDEARSIESLYPLRLLAALADAEETRRYFISNPSENTYRAYNVALRRAINAELRDGEDFSALLTAYLSDSSSFRQVGLGGAITNETLSGSALSIVTRFTEVEKRFRDRIACISGRTRLCEAGALDVSPEPPPYRDTFTSKPLAREVTGIRGDAADGTRTNRVLILSENTCTGLIESPYSFLDLPTNWDLANSIQGYRPPPLAWRDDIVFQNIAHASGDTAEFIASRHGMTYLYLDPMKFYVCPDLLETVGRARAIISIAEFAKNHVDIDVPTRNSLAEAGDRFIREEDALSFLFDTWEKYPNMRNALVPFVNQWREKSAGLEDLVLDIARNDLVDVELFENGVPYELDAKTLFLTHSAFPSLYLLHNPTAGTFSAPLREKTEDDLEEYLSRVELYSKLRETVPRSKIVEDLRSFLEFEKIRPERSPGTALPQ
jgi:hypothetical protein